MKSILFCSVASKSFGNSTIHFHTQIMLSSLPNLHNHAQFHFFHALFAHIDYTPFLLLQFPAAGSAFCNWSYAIKPWCGGALRLLNVVAGRR